MNPLRWVMLRLRAVLARRALERDMQEEMREHLDRAAERFVARGMSPADAHTAALREFGNVALLQERARDARGARWIDALVSDLHFAFRYFARQPLMALTITAVLALGIGVNSAVFSVIQAVTMRPAPAVPKDDAHVRIHGLEQATRGAQWHGRGFSYTELQALAARKEIFGDVAGWMGHDVIIDPGDSSGARGVGAEFVTPNFFAALGVRLVAGPGFGANDSDAPDMAAVLSFALAEDLFGSRRSAIGRAILVNEVPVRIAGVAPPRFQGAIPNSPLPAVWLPVSARAAVARTSPRWLTDGAHLSLFARLEPSATREQATAIAQGIAGRTLPDSAARQGVNRSARVLGMRDPPPSTGPDDELLAVFATGVVALLILLVACTSVSSLLVAAAVGRRQEIAVRLSLGASRTRLLRQLLTESALLAALAGAIGLLVYWWLIEIISTRASDVSFQLGPDLATVAFTMAFALGTGILFGLSPALHATRADIATALRDSAAGVARRTRLQRTFVVAQIVLSQPLLVMLGTVFVFVGSERASVSATVADHVISAQFRPLSRTGTPNQRREAVDSLARRIAERPGVVGVVPAPEPFAIRSVVAPTAMPDTLRDATAAVIVQMAGATPGYFSLVDVPILLGRDVALSDTAGDEIAVVVGSDLARTFWGTANPIGNTLSPVVWKAGPRDSAVMRVVGVFDASRVPLQGKALRAITAHDSRWRRDALLIRTRGPAQAFLPTLRTAIRAEAPGIPVTQLETFAELDARFRRELLLLIGATGAAGALALGLACIGLYGVVSIAVRQRTREIGIRIAVGANPARVARMFLASGMRVGMTGLVLGLPLSIVGLRVLMSQESVIAPDVSVWPIGLGIALVLLLVASAATWLPARQAARVDPATTLRIE